MSHPKPKFTEIDFSSVMQDRRVPLPITHLPVNALTDDTDPTREIRTLIEQLQQTAREARAQQRLAEDERKETEVQLDLARRQNDELRAHFVEITSLIRDRDAALQEVEKQTRTVSEAQSRAAGAEQACQDLRKQCEATGRQRDELARQRDDLNRKIDAVTHTSQETNRCLSEAQRQMLTIRQARDAATAQNSDLAQKLARAEDTIADLEYHAELLAKKAAGAKDLAAEVEALRRERDEAHRNAKGAASEMEQARALAEELTVQANAAAEAGKLHESALSEARKQAGEIVRERDAARLEAEARARELAEAVNSVAALTTEKDEILESNRQYETALADVRQQIAALAGQRDALCADLEGRAKEMEELRQRPDGATHAAAVENLQNEIKTLQHELSTGEVRVQVLNREVLDLRNELHGRAAQIESLQRAGQRTTADMAQTQAQFETLEHEREVARRMREEALTSLASAQKQIDKIIRDRDLVRQQGVENALALEAQIEALRAELQVMELSPGAAMGGHANITEMAKLLNVREHERRELADRLELQRAETIDLGAQLRSAQEQIKQLGASLAEARLLAKMGGRNAASVPAIRESSPREPVTREPITREPVAREPIAREPAPREPGLPPPLPVLAPEAFALAESNDLVRLMKRCYHAFLKNSADVSHLNEIHCHAHNFAERARAGGLVALHRLSAALSGLAQELYHYPEQANSSTLRTIGQTIEFLTTLLKVKDLKRVKDPATAAVYAVDDDAENCDCIRMAMETAMMRTTSSQDPAKAICELAKKPCDLIFLDVNMPGMNGFELCAEIRRLTLHATTPVIFISGLNSSENRVQSNLSGGNEFIAKPFILCELTVKALTLILKSQLHLA